MQYNLLISIVLCFRCGGFARGLWFGWVCFNKNYPVAIGRANLVFIISFCYIVCGIIFGAGQVKYTGCECMVRCCACTVQFEEELI